MSSINISSVLKISRNKIVCVLAITDKKITLGFSDGLPKTLLNGNELKTNPLTVDWVLSKKRNEKKFNKIVSVHMDFSIEVPFYKPMYMIAINKLLYTDLLWKFKLVFKQ